MLAQDLDAALERTRDLFAEMNGARLLITGSTGFVGTLLLESVAHARSNTRTDIRVATLARDPRRLRQRLPWAGRARWLEVVRGDVRDFSIAPGDLDFTVHAANTGTPAEIAADPEGVARMVVEGSRHVFDLAAASGVRRFLQVSSGSVSGEHFTPAPAIIEEDPGIPVGDGGAARLARAKAAAEQSLISAAQARRAANPSSEGGMAVVFARGFGLAGPWLPLDSEFAFGNFIGAGLRGIPIRVSGDGTPIRSYLYASDLVCWLWTLLLKGAPARAYNVGSERPVSIGDLAHRVSRLLGGMVEMASMPVPGGQAHWHVPSTARARVELGLEETCSLDDAIGRTARWWKERGVPPGPSR